MFPNLQRSKCCYTINAMKSTACLAFECAKFSIILVSVNDSLFIIIQLLSIKASEKFVSNI